MVPFFVNRADMKSSNIVTLEYSKIILILHYRVILIRSVKMGLLIHSIYKLAVFLSLEIKPFLDFCFNFPPRLFLYFMKVITYDM
jgi:hypothetical protein